MLLLLIGFVGGLITGISPCVLPVLPVIFFSGGARSARNGKNISQVSRWRPYQVILGLVVSFSFFTLAGTFLLSLLHLPQDLIRWIGLVVLLVLGLGLIIPRVGEFLEKPFSRIPQKAVRPDRNGILLGIALGAVYVPCAGPVLAAITVAGATGNIGIGTIGLTTAFAIGVAIPLLIFALAGRGVAERVKAFRTHQRAIRITAGAVMIALAVGLVFNVPELLQRLIPDYTSTLQQAAGGDDVLTQTGTGGAGGDASCRSGSDVLVDCGAAPPIAGISDWFNTPGDQPIDLADETAAGKVVLLDFWAYSCINCQRATPHVEAWYEAYKDAGLEVIGLHAPEYAFEHVLANVKDGAKRLGITYPVALDNEFDTWTNYGNQYWPAEYLIDADGDVRHISFGEGDYGATEKLIRQLLTAADPGVTLPKPTEVDTYQPQTHALTPETYLGSYRADTSRFVGDGSYLDGVGDFSAPDSLCADCFALEGKWKIADESITPVSGGSITLHYQGTHVYLDVSGTGSLTVTDDYGSRTLQVSGAPNIYDLAPTNGTGEGTLTVSLTKGVSAYSFTFG